MRFFAAFLIVLLGISLLFPLIYSTVASDRDEGVFLLIARELKDGSVLYKDYVDNKPPGIFFMLIPIVMLAGTDVLKIRLAAAAINLLTALFIFLIGKKIGNEKAGAVAAVIYVLLINGFQYVGFLFKTETISNLFICAGVYLLMCKEKKEWRYVAVGIMLAFAGMIRQVSMYALLPVAYWIWTTERQKLRKFALVGVGLLLGLLPFLYYLVSNGVLADMLYYTTTGIADVNNMNAIGHFEISSFVGSVILTSTGFETLFLFLAASYSVKARKREAETKFLWFWFLIALALTPMSAFITIFFMMMAAVPLCLLAAIGIMGAAEEFKELWTGKPAAFERYVKLCLLVLFFAVTVLMYPLSVNGRSEEGGVFANSVTSKDVQYVQDFFEKEGATRPTFFVIMTRP